MYLHNQVLIWVVFFPMCQLNSSGIRQSFRSTSLLDRMFRKNSIEDNELTDLSALAQLKMKSQLDPLESSIISSIEYNFKRHLLLRYNACGKQIAANPCLCNPLPICKTTCLSYESSCGQTCTRIKAVTLSVTSRPGAYGFTRTSTTVQTANIGCDNLGLTCTTTTSIVTPDVSEPVVVVPVVAMILAAAIAVSVSTIGLFFSSGNQIPIEQLDQIISINQTFNSQTIISNLTIPVEGFNFLNDSCNNGSIRFVNRTCYPILQRGPCPPYHWITVDPFTLQGRCTPRLCGRRRVFVGRDQLCHDINDPFECRSGRRLYYTAYGDPICDCPIGQYPFPNANDMCVPLFTRGPCPPNNQVIVSPEGKLVCSPNQCPSAGIQQLIRVENGLCFELGTTGPCLAPFQLFGFDIFQRRGVCVNLQDPSSPYFSSPEEDQLIDNFYNQLSAEYDDIQIILIDGQVQRRQANTLGVFQVPSSLPDPLLIPCRPGARNGLNFKCTNPLLPNASSTSLQQAVRSAFQCPSTSFLQATGQCVNDNLSTSCGPSFRYNPATKQCRSIFQVNNS